MCGILGYIGKRGFETGQFGRALDTMANRGPDDRGIYEEPECILGHRRLSILDLSPSGHQPMLSRDGRFVIVFNGEIYNYRELRASLEAAGVRFASDTDTEVVLELYARQGPECLGNFRGMFAFAIWDHLESELFLARDPMGIKPLYVWQTPQHFAFASEVRALSALPGGPKAISAAAVRKFLLWGSVPSPLTILDGVDCIPPATWARWRRGELTQAEYWTFPMGPPKIHDRAEAIGVLQPLLEESVKLCCISDAPLGAFLSGGIDSSAVVSLMRAVGQSDVRTFSMSFPQTELDEGPYALRVAEQMETLHTNVSVTEQMVQHELSGYFSAMDQPSCDGVNTFLVSKFARQGGLTVSLSGLGGDELFVGYRHLALIPRLATIVALMPRLAVSVGGWACGRLHHRMARLEALGIPGVPLQRLYFGARGLLMPSKVDSLMSPDSRQRAKDDLRKRSTVSDPSSIYGSPQFPPLRPDLEPLHRVMRIELRRYLHNQLLRDSDVFGMANSLEIRPPFLDHKLVEAVFSLMPAILTEGRPKGLLLEALRVPLPTTCVNRPKMGFTFPFDRWMRGPWRTFMDDCLSHDMSPQLTEIVNPAGVTNLWRDFEAGRTTWTRPWSLYALNQYVKHL